MSDMVTVGLFGLIKGLAWPLVIFILALVYRSNILAGVPRLLALFNRRWKAKIPGFVEVEFDAADEQQPKSTNFPQRYTDGSSSTEIKEIASSTIELKEIPGLTRTVAIANLERDIHSRLKSVTADPTDVLVRNLAQARLEAAFGYTYAGIFGSQIRGLIELKARRKVPTDEALNYYRQVESMFPEFYAGYGFAGWLGFLKNHLLVGQEDRDVFITDIGDDFMLWLQAKQLSINKPW